MSIILMRLFYSLWALGALGFLLNALSALTYSKNKTKRLKALLMTPIFCALWPLAICSPAGRRVLFSRFNQL